MPLSEMHGVGSIKSNMESIQVSNGVISSQF